jgi:hypothetical protein
MSRRATNNVRRILANTFPLLDCIDACLDMIEDPSLRKAKRIIRTYRRVAETRWL